MKELTGQGVSNGIAIGKLMYFNKSEQTVPEYEIDDINSELLRYRSALKLAKKHLENLYDTASKRVSHHESVIFHTHIMILEDSQFVNTVENLIVQKRKNAEYAVHVTANKLANIFKQLDDDYLKSRYTDVLDAGNTLLEILQHKTAGKEDSEKGPVIVAAPDLLPSDTVSFTKDNLLGLITNNGSQNSHTAILARTMGVPSVIQIHEPLARFNGMTAIIDGQFGRIIINPDKNTIALYHAKQERYNKQQQFLRRQIGLPAETKNKQKIHLSANLGRLEDIEKARSCDAEGIGLFRSELMFMGRPSCPDEEEQFEAYKTVIKAFQTSRAIIGTVNAGSGKGLDYLDIPKEKNPALGFKGIRISLENKEFFRTQLRALYRASVYGRLGILLPMISCMEEVEYVLREMDKVKSQLRSKGLQYNDNVKIGVKIETPAAALISDQICKFVDFVVIDTDNLIQYTLAMDRDNQKLENFYRPYHPAVKRLMKMTAENAHKNGKWVSVTGELASDKIMTEFFLALRIDELVMIPNKILDIKAKVRACDTTDCSKILSEI